MTQPRAIRLTDRPGTPGDSLTLPHAERHRRRGLLVTDAGAEILLDLPKAAELAEGHALVLENGTEIAIRVAREPLRAAVVHGLRPP